MGGQQRTPDVHLGEPAAPGPNSAPQVCNWRAAPDVARGRPRMRLRAAPDVARGRAAGPLRCCTTGWDLASTGTLEAHTAAVQSPVTG